MGFVPSQIVLAQENRIRSLMYDDHKSDREIIKELNITVPSFYDYKKKIHDADAQIWDKIHVESTKFHVTQLISDLEDCRNLCLKIADNDKEPSRDRIDAYRTACEAKANIVKLLQEGLSFKTSLPYEGKELKATIDIKAKLDSRQEDDNEFTLDLEDNIEEDSSHDTDTEIAKLNKSTKQDLIGTDQGW